MLATPSADHRAVPVIRSASAAARSPKTGWSKATSADDRETMEHLTRSSDSDMTYRIYVRWPNQKVTDKTTTESEMVAILAYGQLNIVADELRRDGAVGIVYSSDGKQIAYRDLTTEEEG
jgi:hypothetical protein